MDDSAGIEPPEALQYRHVLIPLDGSKLAAEAIPTARALAAQLGADLHSVSVAGNAGDASRLGDKAGAALGIDPGDERIAVVVGDDPATGIQRRAQELGSCLVCLSTHGRGRVAGAMVGSVARSLLQQSGEPMVAVGPFADRPPAFASKWPDPLSVDHLVACVDGSAASEAVLPVAAAWATALKMRLTILTVAEPLLPPVRPESGYGRSFGPTGDADEYTKALAARWAGASPEVTGSVAYDPISPASGLRQYLDEQGAGLIAVTTHARQGLRRLLLGAAAASMVHASIAPAVVVPADYGRAP
jgi:nucleotide-binding universal stress UspA family protein